MKVNRPYMIDLYQGDSVVDAPGRPDAGFDDVKALGIAFLDHKASQYRADTMCAFRRDKWMDGKDIKVTDVDGTVLTMKPRFGFYHFNATGPATEEAAFFIKCVKNAGYEQGDDLCLDYENLTAAGGSRNAAYADDFCSKVEDFCGFPAKVYGGNVPREQLAHVSGSMLDRFRKRRLFFCEYAPSVTNIPMPWADNSDGIFQWQDDGDKWGPGPHRLRGIDDLVDNSTVVGTMTVAKVYARWGGGGASGLVA